MVVAIRNRAKAPLRPDGNPRLIAKATPKSSLQQQGGFPILELG